MRRTLDQNSRFHMYLNLVNFDKTKKDALVKKCTGNRTVHSHEMEIEEMHMAIGELRNVREQWMRKHLYVIGMLCTKLRWTRKNDDGSNGIDWPSLNGYVEKYYHKKSIHKLTNEEINRLVVSLRKIAESRGVAA